jgi:hypothetical protein
MGVIPTRKSLVIWVGVASDWIKKVKKILPSCECPWASDTGMP